MKAVREVDNTTLIYTQVENLPRCGHCGCSFERRVNPEFVGIRPPKRILTRSTVCADCNCVVHDRWERYALNEGFGDCPGECAAVSRVPLLSVRRLIGMVLRIPARCRRCATNLRAGYRGITPRWQLCRPCWQSERHYAQYRFTDSALLNCAHCRKEIIGIRYAGCWEDNRLYDLLPDSHHPGKGEACEQCWSWPDTGNCLNCTSFVHLSCADKCDAPPSHCEGHDWTPDAYAPSHREARRRPGPTSSLRDIWPAYAPSHWGDPPFAWLCRLCGARVRYGIILPEHRQYGAYHEFRPPPARISPCCAKFCQTSVCIRRVPRP